MRIVVCGLAGLALAAGLVACGDSGSPTSPTPAPSSGTAGTTPAPTVSAISPASGPLAGGTAVTITGTNFAAGAAVTIGGAPATGVAVTGPTSLTAVTPARTAPGTADVSVTLNGRTGTLPNAFTYIAVSSGGSANAGNTPPVISRIRARGTRPGIPYQFADLGETINITADVQDVETPVDQLTYEWKASAGTISGSGRVVQWTAPTSDTREYDVTLTVIERYQGTGPNGAPATLENRATDKTTISVHDSEQEISTMARQFLVDFSTQAPADLILRNFTVSAGCPKGRAAELDDIRINQTRYKIQSFDIRDPDVTVGFAGVCRYRGRLGDACAYVPSIWHSIDHQNGDALTVADGTDQITAMYEGNRWYLCDSDFIPKGTNGAVYSVFKK